MNNKNHHSL